MSQWYPIQSSFVWGEIDPGYGAQVSADIYQKGLRRCRNMLPSSHGNVATRPGLAYIATIEDDKDTQCRVFPVDIGVDARVLVAFTDGRIQVFTESNLAAKGQLLKNHTFYNGINHWTAFGKGIRKNIHLQHTILGTSSDSDWIVLHAQRQGGGSFEGLRQKVNIAAHTGDMALAFRLYGEWYPVAYSTPTQQHSGTVRVGTTVGGTELYERNFSLTEKEELIVNEVLPGLSGYEGDIYVEITTVNVFAGQDDCTVHINNMSILFDEPPRTGPVEGLSDFASDELDAVQMVQNPYNNAAWFVHPDYAPSELTYSEVSGLNYQYVTFVPASNKQEDPHWIETPNDTDGYPRAIGAYQGRVVFAGTRKEPQSAWTSQVGNWYTVSLQSDLTASAGIWYTLTAIGQIQWVMGFKNLLNGSVNGEHVVRPGSSSDGVLTVDDVQAREHSRYGSAHIQAELVGDECFYVSGDRRKVRYINWDFDTGGWRSVDLTHTASHITVEGVRRLSYGKDPSQILWCPLVGGEVAAMSYDPGLQILGWHRHNMNGEVLDVAEGRFEGVDYVYFAVRRIVDGKQKITLEAMRADERLGPAYLDSYVWFTWSTPQTVVTGLDHLEGYYVTAMENTRTIIGQYTVEGGQITLDRAVSTVVVGLPFTASMETLPPPPAPPSRERGSSHGSTKGWARVGLRLHDSSLPMVNGVQWQVPADTTIPESTVETAFVTRDVNQHLTGWDTQSTLTIEQSLPLRLNIVGIYGKLEDEDF